MFVPTLGEVPEPSVALALAAAAVRLSMFHWLSLQSTYVHLQAERALTLWRDGHILCETVAAHKAGKRSSPIIKLVNKATGKESTRSTDFNQANWGTATSGYIEAMKKLSKFDDIIADARSFAKVNQRGDTTTNSSAVLEQELDERAHLCDDESDDEYE